ncbi:uncharacterized protein STEHIDRAFT_61117 [Stereum hirsutum FP-91666 SS1]|uniref:uncharacterized protein n=1 Tax=Stereum hirsutum (strain FP-91666) TaxID=721885 RepID=UPI0004449AC8|nr:uncharacterized protein STEHIDRAFT_61117 [Stereum hirsutum FP-91666 SS1]EIM84353.1 hypothetical protein STEHIDRAFT_61117 [Stereum hirsutum FP-91666 SS1]
MSTTSTSSDTLPSNVPKLEPNGIIWAIFFERFRTAVNAKNKWAHFDGSSPRPSTANPATQAELAAVKTWDEAERVALYLLSQHLPDSVLVCVMHLTTCEERWKAVVEEMTRNGTYTRTELRISFLEQSP